MEWLWEVAYWVVVAYAVCIAIVFALFFALWILTVIVVLVVSLATGSWTVPAWIEDAWDIFEELFV
jgi:hypothetical protein